jgi:hypothetical protein
MRGVSPKVLGVRDNVKVTSGRFFTPGLYEIVVGKHAVLAYEGLDLGPQHPHRPGTWKVVGVFDAGGSAFDSEIWADSDVLNGNYQRPNSVFQSVTVKLRSADDFAAFDASLHKNPHLQVQAVREPQYYEGQSRTVTTLITVLGGMVALVMGLGAILAALNTMYSAVAERSREIAVLRALGFGSTAIVISFLSEAVVDRASSRHHRLHRGAAGEWHHHGNDELADVCAPVLRVPHHVGPAAAGDRVRDVHGRRGRAAAAIRAAARERGDDASGLLVEETTCSRRPRT